MKRTKVPLQNNAIDCISFASRICSTSLSGSATVLAFLGVLLPMLQGCALVAKPQATTLPDTTITCASLAPILTPEVLAKVAAGAKDLGPLWRIEKEGRVSWLYGTIHMGRLEWQVPGPKVLNALSATDTLALEIDFSPKTAPQPAAVSPASSPPVDKAAAEPVPESLARKIDRFCGYPKSASGWYDRWVGSMTVPNFLVWMIREVRKQEGFYEEFPIEYVLVRSATERAKKIVGLEKPVERQAYADNLNSQLNDLNELVSSNVAIENQTGKKASALEVFFDESVISAWRAHQAAIVKQWTAAEFADCSTRTLSCKIAKLSSNDEMKKEQLNVERESRMANAISQIHESGQRVFAAVGMSHVQPSRLPALLKAKGFKVQFVEN